MKSIALPLAALSLLSTVSHATDSSFKPTSVKAPFVEQFSTGWDTRWKPSEATKKDISKDADASSDLYRYNGEWKVESALKSGLSGDQGLVVKTAAAHHAISASFPSPVDPAKEGSVVVQYDLKLQQDLQCGGAYIKLLTESPAGIQYAEFDDKTPYTIMFGPDKCGTTNKVHFIFRHRNPVTGEFEEKHLKNPPIPKGDTLTNVYTLVIYGSNQTYAIYINKEQAKSGSLLEDFDPPVNPPKEIDDPEDKKPADWVDEPRIPDPDAVKPEDWDEEAPRMIPDEDAKMPSDWLVDEPDMVADPDAKKPEDWDDEEDGEWTAPQVANPKCASVSGCGEWKRPEKPNPAYKGKWYPPLIDNPKYKGPWAPRKIANPNFYEDKTPANLNKIMGVGIELWTMQNEIMFDNFYVGHSLADAFKLADETWVLKRKVEDAKEKEEAKEQEAKKPESTDSEKPAAGTGAGYEAVVENAKIFLDKFAADPVKAVKQYPAYAAAFASLILFPVVMFLLTGGKSAEKDVKYAKSKKDATPSPKKKTEEDDEVAEEIDADDEGDKKLRQRKAAKKSAAAAEEEDDE